MFSVHAVYLVVQRFRDIVLGRYIDKDYYYYCYYIIIIIFPYSISFTMNAPRSYPSKRTHYVSKQSERMHVAMEYAYIEHAVGFEILQENYSFANTLDMPFS